MKRLLMLLLAALIMRAVSLEFRGKVDATAWKRFWDWAFGLGSLLPALLFGVAVGNILRGLPLGADGEYLGGFLDLLNPYALLIGLLSLSMCLLQGTAYLALKTEGERQAGLARSLRHAWLAFAVLYIAATFATGAVSPHLLRRLESAPLVWAFAALQVAVLVVNHSQSAFFSLALYPLLLFSASTGTPRRRTRAERNASSAPK